MVSGSCSSIADLLSGNGAQLEVGHRAWPGRVYLPPRSSFLTPLLGCHDGSSFSPCQTLPSFHFCSWVCQPWARTSNTMSQNKPFLLKLWVSDLLALFCYLCSHLLEGCIRQFSSHWHINSFTEGAGSGFQGFTAEGCGGAKLFCSWQLGSRAEEFFQRGRHQGVSISVSIPVSIAIW